MSRHLFHHVDQYQQTGSQEKPRTQHRQVDAPHGLPLAGTETARGIAHLRTGCVRAVSVTGPYATAREKSVRSRPSATRSLRYRK